MKAVLALVQTLHSRFLISSKSGELRKSYPKIGFSVCKGRPVPYVEALLHALYLFYSLIPCVCDGLAVLLLAQIPTTGRLWRH